MDELAPGHYALRIRAIGFAVLVRDDIVLTSERPSLDLGDVPMRAIVTQLEATHVVAEREETVLALERNSYDVKNMIAASGGTAVDVLRNIPLVEVDGSNKVSLRGNPNVVIQVSGRATPLKGDQLAAFLAQMPAGTLKRVEVVTSPSAKEDPDGTAGIVNLVLNQDTAFGLSGGVTAGTASTGQLSASANVGAQRGRLTLFGSISGTRDRRITSGTISRTNLAAPVPAYVEAVLAGRQMPTSGSGNIRSEVRLTERDFLSVESLLYGGRFDADNTSEYTDFSSTRTIIGQFSQQATQGTDNFSQDYYVGWRRLTAEKAPLLAMEAEYSLNTNRNDADRSGTILLSDSSMPDDIQSERDRVRGRFPFLSWKADYTLRPSADSRIETGLKTTRRSTITDANGTTLDQATESWENAPDRTSAFNYREDIGAAYVLVARKISNVQLQTGLRFEAAATYLTLSTADSAFDRRYGSVYPSAVLAYGFTPLRQAKISYSRRVTRPSPFQLNPIEYRQDTRNVYRGNPGLRAEYTDALELTYQDTRPWGSLQLNPYLRYASHALRNIQYVDSNGVSVSTFNNVARTLNVGSDLSVTVHHGPLQLLGGGSLYHFSSDASNLAGVSSAHSLVWSVRSNVTWKLSSLADAQMFAFYRSQFATEGGAQLATVVMNFAARYRAWGDYGSLSLRVADPFGLQKAGYRTTNGSVIEFSQRIFGVRAVYFTVSRSFGRAIKLQPRQQDPEAVQQSPGQP